MTPRLSRYASNRAPATALILVDGLGLSGKTKSMVTLACGLDPRRYRAEVVCFREADSPLGAALQRGGVPLHHVPCREGLDPTAVQRLMALYRRVRPDVVHCYNPRAMLLGGLAARLSGVGGTLGSLSAFACQVPDRDYDFLPQPLATTSAKNRVRNQLVARLMRRLVAVSRPLGERFCKWNGVALSKLRVVPYGANVDEVTRRTPEEAADLRRRLGVREDEVLVGSIGRLVEQKDYPTQLRAFALAADRVPALRMVLCGDGPLRGELTELARSLHIADRVIFMGHTDEVPVVLRALQIFVLASKFEPYGVALLEAKAAGLAIVATQVNEVPEILRHGQSGALVPSGDPAAMADAFTRLGQDEGARRHLGEIALRDALYLHKLEYMLVRYQDLYDEVRGPGDAVLLPPLATRTRDILSAISDTRE